MFCIKSCFFAGTETNWGEILIGTRNTKLTDATLHYEVDNSAVLYVKTLEETCTTAGTGIYQCSICDATLHTETIPLLGHNYENNNCTRCEVPLFLYELDTNNNAVITGYDGEDACVVIPSTIDGYTVKTIETISSNVNIKSVTIPETVTLIGGLPSSTLTEIIVDKDNKDYCSIDGVLFNKDATTLIMYPNGKTVESYAIPEGVTTIGMGAFAGGRNLRWVKFPSTLKTIEEKAFIESYIQRAVLPEGLETIGFAVFYDCELLQELYLPNTLISIGDYAFGKNDYLQVVDLPDSLESIGEYAFIYSQRLQTVVFGENLKTIGNHAFSCCYALTNVEIPASVTTIGEINFYYCSSLTNIKVDKNNETYCSIDGALFNKDATTLLVYPAGKTSAEYKVPDTVTDISNAAFAYNQYLMSVEIPEGVSSIGDYAFEYCSNLKLLSMPSTITTIGEAIFNSCSAFSHILFAGDESAWNSLTVGSYNSCLTDATRHYETNMSAIAKNCTSEPTCTQEGTASCICTVCETELFTLPVSALGHDIVNNICTRCSAAEFSYSLDENNNVIITGYLGSAADVTVPSEIDGYTVTEIGAEAFANNEVIRNVTLPNTITKIGDMAFVNTLLTSIYIPSSVKEIGYITFAMCLVEDITVDEQNTEYSSKDGVLFDKEQTTLIAYPIGKIQSRYTVPSSVTTIGDYAFMYSQNIKNVQIPDSVTKIGMAAFTYSQGLSNITWSKNLTEIGQMAFAYTGITNVTIPDSVTTIEASAFYYCASLSTVILGNGLTTIGEEAFADCSLLTNITIPDSVITIEDSAFSSCPLLKTVTMGSGVKTVGISAFEQCDSLTDVNYNGTKCQWNQITFNSGNDYLLNATIHDKGDHAFSDYEFATNSGVGENCIIERACSLCDAVETISYILGDVNADSVVDANDYDVIAQASACIIVLTYEQILAADIDGNGIVDAYDAIYLDLAMNNLLSNDEIINVRANAVIPKMDN